MKSRTCFSVVWIVAVSLSAAGCKDGNADANAGDSSSKQAAATLPAGLFVNEPLANARSVAEVMADAEALGDVVIQGRVGGRVKPFVDGAAVFLLADAAMLTCRDRHGDACKTPWDYCCEPKESLMAQVATIQVVDDAGKPLRTSLLGKQDLAPLTQLTIAGEIAHRAGGSLVINARHIHVSKAGA